MEVLRFFAHYIEMLKEGGYHGTPNPHPTTSLDQRDHFGEMGAGTSLSIVTARFLESVNTAMMDSDSSDAIKTLSRVALGALTMIGVSAISIVETISRIALAVLGFSTVYISCAAELVLKASINIIVYTTTLGQVEGLFAFPTFEEGRCHIIPFFFRPAIINVMSMSVGVKLGAKMITRHKPVNFRECVWEDSNSKAFSGYNFVLSYI
jgi:hypothetical protein